MSKEERTSLMIDRQPRFRANATISKSKSEKERDFKLKRYLGLFLTFLSGVILTVRVVIDGRVSFYGVVLGLISKLVVGANFALDPSLEWDAKISYGVPKLFGITTGIITIIGIVINDSDFYLHI